MKCKYPCQDIVPSQLWVHLAVIIICALCQQERHGDAFESSHCIHFRFVETPFLQEGHELAARLEGVAQDLLESALAAPAYLKTNDLRVSRSCSLVVRLLEHGLIDKALTPGWLPYMQAARPSAFDMLQVSPYSIAKALHTSLLAHQVYLLMLLSSVWCYIPVGIEGQET